jgi:hypothetical protein
MDTLLLVTLIGSIATGVGAAVTWYLGKQGERFYKAQQSMAALAEAREWMRDFRNWANEVVDVLSEAAYQLETQDRAIEDETGCSHRLVALVDRGRFFLPNIDDPRFGEGKPSAYQGLRHHLLDPVVAAERVVSGKSGPGIHGDPLTAVVAMRRLFVSAAQRIMQPQHFNKKIVEIVKQAGLASADDGTLGGLIPTHGSIPPGAHGLLTSWLEPEIPKKLSS